MAEEKTQGAGTLTDDAPGENTVQVTFLPEGKTVQFENGKLPYEYHGKEESILDVALNYQHHARPRLRRQLCLHHLSYLGKGRRRESFSDGRRRSGSVGHGRRSAIKLSSRLSGSDYKARQSSSRDSRLEPQLRF